MKSDHLQNIHSLLLSTNPNYQTRGHVAGKLLFVASLPGYMFIICSEFAV